MRVFAIILLLVAAPALAQDAEEPPSPLERRLDELMRDLFSEIEPRLRELRDAIGNLDDYEAPEMLPNGDILIRRKPPVDPALPPEESEAEPDGSIDL